MARHEKMENAEKCVCCGAIIPEGQMACPNCLVYVKQEEDDGCKL